MEYKNSLYNPSSKVGNLSDISKNVDILFETSWEVCNKVGGIYTVLSTKAKELVAEFSSKLVFIGPDIWSDENPSPYFRENKRLLKQSARFLKLPYGITIRTGKWMIPGEPIVILVKYDGIYPHLNDFYGRMWEKFGVDSLHAYGDYDESCAFAIAAAITIEEISNRLSIPPLKSIAHFDEWTTGMGLLYLKDKQPDIATVFTTHATSIGRSICGNGKNLYQYFHAYNGDQMAAELNMQSKHSLEKAAAHAADCFTTVSEVTANECQQLLGIRPQVITPNGFDASFVPDEKNLKQLRKKGRAKILEVAGKLTNHQFPANTFIIATSGRNEFRNKGIDLFLDTINTLREKSAHLDKEVLALILVPAWVKQPAGELLLDMQDNGNIKPETDFLTHRLNNEDSDAICCKIRSLGANENPGKVRIMFVPCYLDGFDGIINISYYNLLPAIDITLFPSYYEPWGYTPLESIAFGVPTVTTDKAGFGQWVAANTINTLQGCGVKVLPRDDSDYNRDVTEAADIIADTITLPKKAIQEIGLAANDTASLAAWSIFIKHYNEAFIVALKRRNERIEK